MNHYMYSFGLGGKRVYYRSGVTSDNKSGDEWVKVSDSYYEGFTQISVGGGFGGGFALPVVWGVNDRGSVYSREGISASNLIGT